MHTDQPIYQQVWQDAANAEDDLLCNSAEVGCDRYRPIIRKPSKFRNFDVISGQIFVKARQLAQ